jgi:predicted RNA polymerase sigma factor
MRRKHIRVCLDLVLSYPRSSAQSAVNFGRPIQVPGRDELAGRLDAVLAAIYAAFAEGWSDPGGTDVAARDLAEEAVYLGGVVAGLLPEEPEPLLALMLHAEARRRARRSAAGDYVPLAEQDTAQWDAQMIDRAERLLLHASGLGAIGRYQLEAGVQSAHAHRRRTGEANWPAVAQLYDALLAISSSPVVAVNSALAVAQIDGAAAALRAIEAAAADSRLLEYQPYWAARAELLARTGANDEAARSYEIAIGLERDAAVRRFLQQRRSALI